MDEEYWEREVAGRQTSGLPLRSIRIYTEKVKVFSQTQPKAQCRCYYGWVCAKTIPTNHGNMMGAEVPATDASILSARTTPN
jgi:hypothetical protein